MTLEFSPEKKRVKCTVCHQFQPVLTQRRDGDLTLVCGACLHGISTKPPDLEAAKGIVSRELPARETVVKLTDEGKKALDTKGLDIKKTLLAPKAETRPARNEGTR
jgi:hypothetical protein